MQKLLQCLRPCEENGQKKWPKPAPKNMDKVKGCAEETMRPCHLHVADKRWNMLKAEGTLHGVCFSSPSTTSAAVAAYYHSAVVELKQLVQQAISANPFGSLEDAILKGLADLDGKGLTCPLSFYFRGKVEGANFRSSVVDDVHVVLAMRQEALKAPSRKAVQKLKEKWAEMAQCRAEKADALGGKDEGPSSRTKKGEDEGRIRNCIP